jgi:AhpD family alkylhydroperoxidase
MTNDWLAMITSMDEVVRRLRDAHPGMMKAFATLVKSAHGGAVVDGKTKELIALAIGVATRCEPCIAYHVRDAQHAGASRDEIAETLAMAVYMGAGPSAMYAANVLEAFDQLQP